MKKVVLSFFLALATISGFAQIEKFPIFKECESFTIEELPSCFKAKLNSKFFEEFKIPVQLVQEKFEGTTNVVLTVSNDGKFKVIYVNSPYKVLKSEIERVFNALPQVTPASYNNHAIEMQFVFPLKIPISSTFEESIVKKETLKPIEIKEDFVNVVSKNTLYPEHKSELNIPFTHLYYNSIEKNLNSAENTHTSMKPYLFSEVSKYVDLDAEKGKLHIPKSSWFGKKLFNEHMVNVQGKDYWFTLDPAVDIQIGKDSEDLKTFNNTRAVIFQGGLGSRLSFSASFYESQGRFAGYFNDYARSLKPDGGNPAIIPGRGIAKEFKSDAFDYPVADGYISYTPNKFFNFQFGHGKNFIGDGYRSLFLSDVASQYPYFKMNTSFWKIKYTNLWMTMQDVRPELTEDGAYKQKFMAIHYLSLNVTKKLNVGLFEAVVWDDVNNRGFDVNYLNPLIFYTAVEFSTGSRAGNSLLGLSLKYKMKNISLYSQILIDEFRVSEIGSDEGWWGNKNGIQFGLKYHNAFNIENLTLQAEFNAVRPFTYSHDELNYNFGHNNQPLAHLWGSNFREAIAIVNYTKDRWFANAKLVLGEKGFDFNTTDTFSYGGNVYRDNDERWAEYGNEIGQGNKTSIFVGDFQLGYLVNPTTNLKLFGGLTVRNFTPDSSTSTFDKRNSTWLTFGLKTDVFNWYFDF
ncbi:gliding motility protein RemB [Lutibacter sp.]|uniref:gliding motility protein RemB n=1 Tax=Lutibacter sp. TaxID=1925666 RepID=UPI002734E12D|nr:gliding motility protein RemB [Lutibacter sp.]MDP3314257.1 gliding motility protein RemB [Lutibacter sp.]